MSAPVAAALRRVAVRSAARVPPVARGFATKTKSAPPETPLMHYTATQQATSSINHR
eukprot:CAMPEP_0176234446 /NCGR_PEP_ID=MMETSP0121_2-20121125/26335_1 /TAXON_ID=160619 /ORGANISM="Kryptoperidinium foliaceum, Strain CCMP 1326" /LENGTH=56 /DNA_ID=CAMNT_0017573853 /DNA_START=52 /DNA_END=218 /DNA_ORIENTATION=+